MLYGYGGRSMGMPGRVSAVPFGSGSAPDGAARGIFQGRDLGPAGLLAWSCGY